MMQTVAATSQPNNTDMNATFAIPTALPAHLHASVTQAPMPATLMDMSMRHLRALLAVARCGTAHKAALSLCVTQPAVTRAIQELEQELGLQLFERTTRSMSLTRAGELLYERTVRALNHLDQAERELIDINIVRRPRASLVAKVTHRHLRTLVAVAEHHTETSAALHLELSQPSVTRALRELECIVETPLFQRTTRGMLATSAGEVLIRRAKLMFAELAAARDDLASHGNDIGGRIVIGSLPLASTLLVPRAVTLLKKECPSLSVTILEGAYQSLLDGLRCGDIDVLVGVLRDPAPCNDIVQEALFEDQLSVVVRPGHPLTKLKYLTLADVIDAEWVLPYQGAPSRQIFERVLSRAGLAMPRQAIESNALLTIRALLLESDRVSILSRNQIHYEALHDMLVELPIDMRGSERQIGLTMRADIKRSAGANALIRSLRTTSIGMQRCSCRLQNEDDRR